MFRSALWRYILDREITHTVEDHDDEEHFEFFVYGQGESDKDARSRPSQLCGMMMIYDGRYMPVQDDAKFEDGDTNQLGHRVFVCLERFYFGAIHVIVCVASMNFFYFLWI